MFTGLTTWDNITYEVAAKAMKAALEQGANFWNGVSKSPPATHPRNRPS